MKYLISLLILLAITNGDIRRLLACTREGDKCDGCTGSTPNYECVCSANNACTAVPTCGTNQIFDSTKNVCICDANACKNGCNSDWTCVADTTCGTNQVFDSTQNACVCDANACKNGCNSDWTCVADTTTCTDGDPCNTCGTNFACICDRNGQCVRDDCTTNGCDTTTKCDTSTGQCVDDTVTCGTNEILDTTTNTCKCKENFCRDNNACESCPPTCPKGEKCDSCTSSGNYECRCDDTNTCVAVTCDRTVCTNGCELDGSCIPDTTCDTTVCPNGCEADGSCIPDTTCDKTVCPNGCEDDGSCIPDTTCDKTVCPNGCEADGSCIPDTTCDTTVCTNGCEDDGSCIPDTTCDTTVCPNGCEADGSCIPDTTQKCDPECTDGKVCKERSCVCDRDNNKCATSTGEFADPCSACADTQTCVPNYCDCTATCEDKPTDPCDGVECDVDTKCIDGRCYGDDVDKCDLMVCDSGKCDTSTGECVDDGTTCDITACDPCMLSGDQYGKVCKDRRNNCEKRACPTCDTDAFARPCKEDDPPTGQGSISLTSSFDVCNVDDRFTFKTIAAMVKETVQSIIAARTDNKCAVELTNYYCREYELIGLTDAAKAYINSGTRVTIADASTVNTCASDEDCEDDENCRRSDCKPGTTDATGEVCKGRCVQTTGFGCDTSCYDDDGTFTPNFRVKADVELSCPAADDEYLKKIYEALIKAGQAIYGAEYVEGIIAKALGADEKCIDEGFGGVDLVNAELTVVTSDGESTSTVFSNGAMKYGLFVGIGVVLVVFSWM